MFSNYDFVAWLLGFIGFGTVAIAVLIVLWLLAEEPLAALKRRFSHPKDSSASPNKPNDGNDHQ